MNWLICLTSEAILKIAEYCASIRLKPRKFAARARRFVSLPSSSTKQSIQEQWKDLEE